MLDTHALIWGAEMNPRLSRAALEAMSEGDNAVYVSAVSALEIAQKHRLGKLPNAGELAVDFERQIEGRGLLPLPITLGQAQLAGGMDIPHKDPFDRLLIAQSLLENLVLVSNEAVFDGFGVNRLW